LGLAVGLVKIFFQLGEGFVGTASLEFTRGEAVCGRGGRLGLEGWGVSNLCCKLSLCSRKEGSMRGVFFSV